MTKPPFWKRFATDLNDLFEYFCSFSFPSGTLHGSCQNEIIPFACSVLLIRRTVTHSQTWPKRQLLDIIFFDFLQLPFAVFSGFLHTDNAQLETHFDRKQYFSSRSLIFFQTTYGSMSNVAVNRWLRLNNDILCFCEWYFSKVTHMRGRSSHVDS